MKTLGKILRKLEDIPNFNKEKPEDVCQHVTGWTWKTGGSQLIMPKILSGHGPESRPRNLVYSQRYIKKFQQNLY